MISRKNFVNVQLRSQSLAAGQSTAPPLPSHCCAISICSIARALFERLPRFSGGGIVGQARRFPNLESAGGKPALQFSRGITEHLNSAAGDGGSYSYRPYYTA